jgi:hypothetical protein
MVEDAGVGPIEAVVEGAVDVVTGDERVRGAAWVVCAVAFEQA